MQHTTQLVECFRRKLRPVLFVIEKQISSMARCEAAEEEDVDAMYVYLCE